MRHRITLNEDIAEFIQLGRMPQPPRGKLLFRRRRRFRGHGAKRRTDLGGRSLIEARSLDGKFGSPAAGCMPRETPEKPVASGLAPTQRFSRAAG
jgi:hypothetical protein